MSAPRISVVIPTHQHAEFIGRTIGCVLAQSFEDFEIVVVDNGSTDGTEGIVRGIHDDRIIYHWQEDSGLPANSRNVGISMATGELVAFLDSDDSWYPEKLSRVNEAFMTVGDLDVFCHGMAMVRGEQTKRMLAFELSGDEDPYERLLYSGNFMTTSATTVRRERFQQAGGFSERKDFVTAEDYDLWLRLAALGSRFIVTSEILGEYALHESNASANLERIYESAFRALEQQYMELARSGDLDSARAVKRRQRARLAMIRDLARSGHPLEASRWLAQLPGELSAARVRYETAVG